ncbi:spore coat protein [Pseudoxanthomonas sp. PXM01]|uniref:spore coat protein n=1 Tax=Pseudoxanthomonas sp. PXM01 TaxID=2769295 RepID=UPI00177DDF91|nr:spore coat protein [Pseudoxanthomonas sp. PXM01]MBD9467753.1 spore coat protein [Pseudoxanthomonas sp. PXM01]
MASKGYEQSGVKELLLQALETERGGIKIYTAAVNAAVNDDLREEWQEYLEETEHHEEVLTQVFGELGMDTEEMSPGREVCAHLGASLVAAIEMAQANADPAAAELVACECVVLAETKDHTNWELIGKVAEAAGGKLGQVLKAAYDEVEDDEDHHLYHTKGWCRELWIQSLGMPAVLPPPEEVKKVETAIGAARAEQAREDML